MHCPALHRRARGFTLIELLIAVAIVAILARVALPTFFDTIRKSRRSDAIAAISMVQQAQERYRASNTKYGDNFATYTSGGSFYGVAQSTDAAITGVTYASSYTTANGYYTLTLSGGSSTYASTYNIVAQAQGSQANDSKCKYIEVDVSAGNFTYKSGSTSSTTTDTGTCWKK